MRRKLGSWALIALAVPLAFVAAWQVFELLRVFSARTLFPMDIEWMEGGQLYAAYRFLHGLPIYDACSDGFVPFAYPPGHFVVLALFGTVFKLDYALGRSVSIGAFALAGLVLCREVARTADRGQGKRSKGLLLALVAAGAIAASYPVVGAWYDVIRVDSVFVAFLFAGAALSLPPSQHAPTAWRLPPGRMLLSALALTAALFTKQTAVFFIPWVCLHAVLRDRRSGTWLAVLVSGLSACLLALLVWVSNGQFWTLVYEVMSRHEVYVLRGLQNTLLTLVFAPYLPLVPLAGYWIWRKKLPGLRLAFWGGIALCVTPVLAVALAKASGAHMLIAQWAMVIAGPSLAFASYLPLLPLTAYWILRGRRFRSRSSLWLGMLMCAVPASIFTAAKIGAFRNNLMTVAMLAGPVALMMAAELHAKLNRRRVWHYLWAAVLCLGATRLLYQQRYDSTDFAPTARQWWGAFKINELVASMKGGVLIPAHPFLAVRNGHTHTQIHEQGYVDVMGAGIESIDVSDCLAPVEAEWLIVNNMAEPHLEGLLETRFEHVRALPTSVQMLVGMYTKPRALFRRRPNVPKRRKRLRRRMLFDFESGDFAGWEQEGDAFRQGPTIGRNGYQLPIVGHRGHWLVSSFSRTRYDAATGLLRSPSFIIDRAHMSLRVGGGPSPALQVRLVVDGEVVRTISGVGRQIELLFPFVWDVSAFRSRRAHIEISDASPDGWGHMLVDAIELFDVAP